MKTVRHEAPTLLLILFEIVVGILLLTNPEGFTHAIIVLFGVVNLIIGFVHIIRYGNNQKEGVIDHISLPIAAICFIIGLIAIFATKVIMGLFAVIAAIYGVILIISGIYKWQNNAEAKRLGWPNSVMAVISAILSIALGIVILLNPFQTTMVLWQFAGISLIVTAVVDVISLVVAGRQ